MASGKQLVLCRLRTSLCLLVPQPPLMLLLLRSVRLSSNSPRGIFWAPRSPGGLCQPPPPLLGPKGRRVKVLSEEPMMELAVLHRSQLSGGLQGGLVSGRPARAARSRQMCTQPQPGWVAVVGRRRRNAAVRTPDPAGKGRHPVLVARSSWPAWLQYPGLHRQVLAPGSGTAHS